MTLLIFFLKKIFYNKNKNKERFFSNKITRFFFTNTLYTCPNTHAKLTAASCLGDGVGPIFTLQSRRGQRPVVRKRRGNQRRNRSGRCGGGGGRRTEMASKAARTPPAVPSAGSTRRRAPPARLPLRPSTGTPSFPCSSLWLGSPSVSNPPSRFKSDKTSSNFLLAIPIAEEQLGIYREAWAWKKTGNPWAVVVELDARLFFDIYRSEIFNRRNPNTFVPDVFDRIQSPKSKGCMFDVYIRRMSCPGRPDCLV
ncbi:uncharacterized protein LOC122046673 isoform X1 [Zingiber officinale]|uniref:uncharacterized protein LOC122046673 isoform X1 n=1 Tax=Zingiber officinale TaxID=94328 RepID=UPI001C4C096C|nr:uncharacterized protein LOC122046673 isoform X1 [Zingiber officinale]